MMRIDRCGINITPSPAAYVTFGVIWGGCLAISIYDGIVANMVVSLVLLILSFFAIASYRITLNEGGIAYRSLFGGTRFINRAEIKNAEIRSRLPQNFKSDMFSYLVIDSVRPGSEQEIII